MARKDGEGQAPAVPRRGDARPTHYRCRTTISYRILEESQAMGPGKLITADEYERLIRDGLVRSDLFEPAEGEAQ